MTIDGQYLVTGASRGIGGAIARGILQAGGRVIGLSRTGGELQGTSAFEHAACDFSDLNSLPQRLRAIRKTIAGLDGLILNAGYGRFGALEEFSATQIRELIDVNLTSQILVAREFLPLLKRQKSGDVIIIGSEAALKGGQRGAVYSATKFALRGFAQSLREECAASGVRVTLVNPGMVQSGFFAEQKFRPSPEPGCHLLPQDVADAVLFVLAARPGSCFDEINLSPQKKVIEFGDRGD
jgi:short-subunit dehydrogenase